MQRFLVLPIALVTYGWTAWTLYQVQALGRAVLGRPEATMRLMSVDNDGVVSSAIGLTYHGTGGALLAATELGLVLAAAVASGSRRARLRRPGLVVLALWSLLWLGNAVWIESLDGWNHPSATGLLAGVTAVVLVHAGSAWSRGEDLRDASDEPG